MFSPSPNILINFVDIYRNTNATDVDGGFAPTYSLVASSVACSVQYDDVMEAVDESTGRRITEGHQYLVIFGTNPRVSPRDKLIWRDVTGTVVGTLFVQASENCAGRSGAWAIKAIERV